VLLLALKNLEKTAVINNEFETLLAGFKPSDSINGAIQLRSYEPNKLDYDYNAPSENLVVFSEIWTQKGWKLFIDGEQHPIIRANYLLRAALVPAGQHKIEMRYEPAVWAIGEKVSLASSLLLILLALGLLVQTVLKSRRNNEKNSTK